jgi:hypothetical protein
LSSGESVEAGVGGGGWCKAELCAETGRATRTELRVEEGGASPARLRAEEGGAALAELRVEEDEPRTVTESAKVGRAWLGAAPAERTASCRRWRRGGREAEERAS